MGEEDIHMGGSGSSSSTPMLSKSLRDFDVAAHFDTHPSLLSQKANRPRLRQLETGSFADQSVLQGEAREAYRQLYPRQERAKRLACVREELELRKHLRS